MEREEDRRFFRYKPAEDHPGWYTWNIIDETRFNHAVMGPMLIRLEGDKCRVRMTPERKHSNLQDMIHGAVTLALIDISLFAGMRTLTDNEGARAVTLELSTQFIGAGRMEEPLDSVVEETLEANGLDRHDIDWLIPHQANLRIIEATAKRLDMPMDRVIVTVDKHGNTSSGSVPLALDEAVRSGKVQRGQLVLLEAFGGGFTWGSVLLRY